MEKTVQPTTLQQKFLIHEDWAVVVLGFLIIILFVIGLVVPVPTYSWSNSTELFENVLAGKNLLSVGAQFLLVFIFSVLAATLTNKGLKSSVFVFPIIYLLTVVALILAGNKQVKGLNLEAVIFSLAIGLLISNVIKLPDWFRAALATELFVKIGLVLLGTSVIFSDILKAGSLGLIQALVVVISVWYFA